MEDIDKEMQEALDTMALEELKNRAKTDAAFIEYLADKAIGDKNVLIQCYYELDSAFFIGYKTVTKELNSKGELILNVEVEGYEYKATWQPSDNYATWQTCGVCGDDYSGFLLFPTYKENEYFVLQFTC